MIILANLLNAVAVVLNIVLNTLLFIVVLRAIISWVNPDPYNPIVRFLIGTTEPFLKHLRRFIPNVAGRIDITPIVLILIIAFLQAFLVQTLSDYYIQMRRSIQNAPAVHEGSVEIPGGRQTSL